MLRTSLGEPSRGWQGTCNDEREERRIMKTIDTALFVLFVMSATACAGSNSNVKSKVSEARTDVNESLERVEAKARPAVSPVAKRVDRGADQAAEKLGLRRRPEEQKEK